MNDWRVISNRFLPKRTDYPSSRREVRADVVAGITVGVVALPLALGFGVASGAGATAGIITAIVAGIVAAIFGGSDVQVSGPTGAMTVVLIPIVATHGAVALPILAIFAGALIVIGGCLGLGRAVTLVPWPVIEGFTVGIALVIFLQQLTLLLAPGGTSAHNALRSTVAAIDEAKWGAAVTPLIVAACVVVGAAVVHRVQPQWPATLIVLIAATGICVGADVAVPSIGQLSFSPHLPDAPHDLHDVGVLARAAIVIALLAALESLLSARVADGMGDSDHVDPDRELIGQGLANIAAGVAGGVPATGAIARTAVNVRAGARTRVSAIIHSAVVLVLVVAGGGFVESIPLAALAGVLMFTALRMVDTVVMRALLSVSRSDALIYTATAFATVIFDLIRAVELGIAIAVVLALRAAARANTIHEEDLRDHVEDSETRELLERHIVVYRLHGSLFFGAAQRFLDKVADAGKARVVVLRLGSLHLLDSTGAHAIAEQVASFQRHNVDVLLCGVRPNHRRLLAAVSIPGTVLPQERIFARIDLALDCARGLVSEVSAPER